MTSLQKGRGSTEGVGRGKYVVKWVSRCLLALVPLGSVGLLCPVPSAVVAARRRRRADWVAFAGFTVLWLLWIADLAESPDGGTGLAFAGIFVLLVVSTVGAALHSLLAWSDRPQGES